MVMSARVFALVACVLLLPVLALAQGNPTGAISGKVLDTGGLAVPGATVTARSPAMQGSRTVTSSESGDYIVPFLPPGIYSVTFELAGFQTQQRDGVGVVISETVTVNVALGPSSVSETVDVQASTANEIGPALTVATTFKASQIELLPVGRTLNAAVLLAPGVQDNGPGGNIMISGAMSYENQFLINGVVVNENLRGQARNLFIEDAIQETKVSTGNLSAEYGRFQGGVVNMVTKSGGNRFSGSFRTSFANDSWGSLTPFEGDAAVDKTVPTYEITFGGPVLRERLWFFTAGRFEKNEENLTASYTAYNYTRKDDEKRSEGKLTYALTTKHTAKAAYTKRRLDAINNSFGTIMDARSLYDNANDEDLLSLNYTGVLTDKWFVEGQYSARDYAIIGTGGRLTDIPNGTPIWDRSRGQARFNAATFCAVCGSGVEDRNNWNVLLKTSYFLSTPRFGSHTLVLGGDLYRETRENDNFQSGSSFRVQSTGAVINGQDIYPIFRGDNTTFIEYLPLVAPTQGNDIRTTSFFANDTWRLNTRLTFNVGLRFDQNNSKDQAGAQVVEDSAWSPRLGATWSIDGAGKWVANAGYARYVTGMSTAIVDAGSAGGRTATFSYFYQGPNVNADPTRPLLTAEQALPIIFGWFEANGGINRATRNAPNIPGVTTTVGSGLVAPSSTEWTAGLVRQLGSRATVRLDWVHREFTDFYGDFRDTSTGKVTDPTGRVYDLTVVGNTDVANRSYKGLVAQASYRASSVTVGGNYTLSWLRGNFEGEDTGSGPVRFSGLDQPEYRGEAWSYPTGNFNDQRHKLRAWVQYSVPVPATLGRLELGFLQRFDTSDASSIDGTIDPRPYVTNPGYQATPSTVPYFFGDRGALRYDDVFRSDLSVYWGKKITALGGSEVFFRGIVTNLFNHSAQTGGNETVLTRTNDSSYQLFNPFTQTPVRGVHYDLGPIFGQPTGVGDYQGPRDFSFSVGVRF
jgi:outer membrane receptor for ferrienterochelin and colicin